LDFSAFTHFTLFESDFVDITSDNYSWVKTANSKVLLFIVASGTFLIEFWLNMKSLTLRKRLLKLLYQNYDQYIISLVYRYVFSLLDKFFSLYWIEDNKSSSTFYDKSDNAVLSYTPNLWNNI